MYSRYWYYNRNQNKTNPYLQKVYFLVSEKTINKIKIPTCTHPLEGDEYSEEKARERV